MVPTYLWFQLILIEGIVPLVFSLLNTCKTHPQLFRKIPQPYAFVAGFYNDRYSAVDHFHIIPWILLICLGSLSIE